VWKLPVYQKKQGLRSWCWIKPLIPRQRDLPMILFMLISAKLTRHLVLPALESDKALAALNLWQKNSSTPICFDFNAYKISSSKQESNNLFSRLGIPKPMDWPQCGFPVVVKPSAGSGSHGVRIISSKDEWEKSFNTRQLKDPSAKEPLAKKQLSSAWLKNLSKDLPIPWK
jgi:carbamoylphosphate synthase large subunit